MTDRVYATKTWRIVREQVIARDGGVCQICKTAVTGDGAVDHIVPWREGGPWYDLDNLRLVHTRCNSARVKRSQRAGASQRRPSRKW